MRRDSSIRRGLLSFDVAGAVPLGAIITDVTLTLWDVRGLNGSRAVNLHRLLADWGEGASLFNGGVGGPAEPGDATWFSRLYDPSGGPSWSTPGGDFDPVVSGSALVTEHPVDQEKAFSWLGSTHAGMIADVQSWLDDPASNFGWMLRGDESRGQTAKRFRSGDVAGSPFGPTLAITFQVVPEPGSIALAAIGAAATAAVVVSRRRRSAGVSA